MALAACGGNGASREVLVDTLQVQGQLSKSKADCVATALYGNNIGLDEGAINSASTQSDPEKRPEGYDQLVTESLDACGVGSSG